MSCATAWVEQGEEGGVGLTVAPGLAVDDAEDEELHLVAVHEAIRPQECATLQQPRLRYRRGA